jgi:predicted DNA-binding antitoxin AbrB/MazE fold protein
MTVYPTVRARYTKGILKLRKPLKLAEGTEVQVTVTPVETAPTPRRKAKPRFTTPTRALPPGTLAELDGLVSLGGDALADSEALYDGDA